MTDTESLFDFQNHVTKCRCCLKEFEIDDTQIKITEIVQIRFQELTQMIVSEIPLEEIPTKMNCYFISFEVKNQ